MRAQGSTAVATVGHISGAHRGTAEVGGRPPTPTSGTAQGLVTGALGMKTQPPWGPLELTGLLLIRGPQGRIESEVSSSPPGTLYRDSAKEPQVASEGKASCPGSTP